MVEGKGGSQGRIPRDFTDVDWGLTEPLEVGTTKNEGKKRFPRN
jgi:hypothetical protein